MSTTRPDRRSLLLAGGAGTALFTSPGWIRAAFGGQSVAGGGREGLEGAVERAKAARKPLMVILVPAEDRRLERGRLWGDLFGMAPEAAMADFALCEWTCASTDDLLRVFVELQQKALRESVAVLIETDGAPPKWRFASFDPPGDLGPRPMGGFPVKEMQERAADLARALQAIILPDADTILRRSMQAGSTGEDEAAEPPYIVEEGFRPRLKLVDRWAAKLRAQAEHWPNARASYTSALAQAAALRLWESEPEGAAWKTEHVDPCPPCGMARMPGSSRSFLEFYTKPR